MAGVRLRGGDAQDSATVCVIRLLGDGRPDPAFSGDGVAIVDHGYGNDSAEAVVLRGGKVIVAGDGRRASAAAASGSRGCAATAGSTAPSAAAATGSISFGARRIAGAYALAAGPARPLRGRRQRGRRGPRAADRARPARPRRRRRSAASRTSPGPFGGYARAVRATRGGILVAGRALHRARHRPLGLGARPLHARRPPARRRPAPTSARARTSAEAIALTPGHATVAGSIYASHGVARYLTR